MHKNVMNDRSFIQIISTLVVLQGESSVHVATSKKMKNQFLFLKNKKGTNQVRRCSRKEEDRKEVLPHRGAGRAAHPAHQACLAGGCGSGPRDHSATGNPTAVTSQQPGDQIHSSRSVAGVRGWQRHFWIGASCFRARKSPPSLQPSGLL